MFDNDFFSIEPLVCDSDFCDRFCMDCPAIHRTPATLEEPAECDCPASFEPWDSDCWKYDNFKAIEKAIEACNAEIASLLNN